MDPFPWTFKTFISSIRFLKNRLYSSVQVSSQGLWRFRSKVSRCHGWRPAHLASSWSPCISMKGLLWMHSYWNVLWTPMQLKARWSSSSARNSREWWGARGERKRQSFILQVVLVTCSEASWITALKLVAGWATCAPVQALAHWSLWGVITASASNTVGAPLSHALFWVQGPQQRIKFCL